MSAILAENHHGKGRVRVVKVRRNGPKHDIYQYNVKIILHGPLENAFLYGDNSIVVPTDTQKNTVYVLAKKYEFESSEEFSLIIARHFVRKYPKLVTKAEVTVQQDTWERIECKNTDGLNMKHNHGFQKVGPHFNYSKAEVEVRNGTILTKLWGGICNLTLMKTTQSSFVGFHKDEFTTLPDATDRLLGSSIDCQWRYNTETIDNNTGRKFNIDRENLLQTFIDTFFGPSDVGTMSASVQATAFQMGSNGLMAVSSMESITLYMPNIHNMPFDLSRFGLSNVDHTGNHDIFYPIDEPHGIIQVTVNRPHSKL